MKNTFYVGVLQFMRFFKKTVTFSLIIVFFALLLGIIFLYGMKTDLQFRDDVIVLANKLKNFIYFEATIHNPEGDMLPDQIDNNIITETKNIFK